LKFGAVGPAALLRRARSAACGGAGGAGAALERALLWREFYHHLGAAYPQVLTAPNAHIRPHRQRVRWPRTDAAALARWKAGRTGDALVDAAMRSLRATGWLHNRLRMVAASFLVKEMGVDWRDGEREMATMLVDYDPCNNSGGWQAMDAQLDSQRIRSATQRRRFGSAVGG
jgi:deoxyribodipyrimidine photo-lyase